MKPLIIDEDMIDRDDFEAQSVERRDHDYNANSLRARFYVEHEGEDVEVAIYLTTPFIDERELYNEMRSGNDDIAEILRKCSYQHEDMEVVCEVAYILTPDAQYKLEEILSDFVHDNYVNDLERFGMAYSDMQDSIITERDIELLDELEEKFTCVRNQNSIEINFSILNEVVTLTLVIDVADEMTPKEYIITYEDEVTFFSDVRSAKEAMSEKAEKLSSMCKIDRAVEKKTGEHRGDKAQELLDRIDSTAGEEKSAKQATRQKI